jgi:hypothetical protein
MTTLAENGLVRAIGIVILAGVMGMGGKMLYEAKANTAAQENRDLASSLYSQYGNGGGNYTTSATVDVTVDMINAGLISERLIDRSVSPPELRVDDSTITLSLQPQTYSVTRANLKMETCVHMVTTTDILRTLRRVTVNGTAVSFTATNRPTKDQLRTVAQGCSESATVAWAWGN